MRQNLKWKSGYFTLSNALVSCISMFLNYRSSFHLKITAFDISRLPRNLSVFSPINFLIKNKTKQNKTTAVLNSVVSERKANFYFIFGRLGLLSNLIEVIGLLSFCLKLQLIFIWATESTLPFSLSLKFRNVVLPSRSKPHCFISHQSHYEILGNQVC